MLNQTLYSNYMVFQFDQPIRLVGEYQPNETLTIKIIYNNVIWLVDFATTNYKGFLDVSMDLTKLDEYAFSIIIESKNHVEELSDCRLGYVFLAMGQSNMRMPLKYIDDVESIINTINRQPITFLSIDDNDVSNEVVTRPLEPKAVFTVERTRFRINEIESVLEFSAIMVCFAIDFYELNKRPIEIIDVSVPGCSIYGYLSQQAVENNQELQESLYSIGVLPITTNHYTVFSGIFNEKIYPLRFLRFESVVWLQGEHHVNDQKTASHYKEALEELIISYRLLFEQPNLTWMNIHIQNHFYTQDKLGIGVVLINEAMNKTAEVISNVYTIPVHDQFPVWKNKYVLDEANPIHPTNKSYIGKRLSKALSYKDSILEISEVQFQIDYAVVVLNQEIEYLEGHLYGFTIGHESQPQVYAEAIMLDRKTIKVYAENVKVPEVLTYGFFLYNDRCQLLGKHGIPLKPFRIGKFNNHTTYYQPYGFEALSTNCLNHLGISMFPNQLTMNDLVTLSGLIPNQLIRIEQTIRGLKLMGNEQFSLEVNLTQNAHKSMLKYYRFVAVAFEQRMDFAIESLVFISTDRQFYQVKPLKVDLNNRYVFDLYQTTKLEQTENCDIEAVLSQVGELHLVCRFKQWSKVVIKSIRLYNSGGNHV